ALGLSCPRSGRPVLAAALAPRAPPPAAPLAAALGREPIADPPDSFGTIRARHLLASIARASKSAPTRQSVPREQHDHVLAELAEDEDDGTAADVFSSPVSGRRAVVPLLGQFLGVVRQLDGGCPPAAVS